jgi:hypothetical protein
MRNSGEMNHSLNVFQQRSPFDRAGQIGYGDDFDRSREYIGRLPHCRAHGMSHAGELCDQGASDEA